MTEPISSSAGGIALGKWLWPLAKLLGIPAAGLVGALLVAAFDPSEAIKDPKKRRRLLVAQYTAALVVASLFTLGTVRWLDYTFDWITLPQKIQSVDDMALWFEFGLPVAFLYGGLSIGLIGALVKLRQIIADRGADAVADRIGLGDGQ